MAPFSLCWRRWYILHIHHFADGIWNIYTTLRDDWFSSSFLSETPPDPPVLWSIPWEVPERVSLMKLRRSWEERQVTSSGYLYVQEMCHVFPSLVHVSSLCRHRLAYILYESWLLGVFRIYTTFKPRSMQLQASSNLDSRVVYTRNTPCNHDLYITYFYESVEFCVVV